MSAKPTIPQKKEIPTPADKSRRPASGGTRPGPIALVTKFPVHRCRECGEPVKTGERTWWLRAVGTAHLTCGWTLPNGKVHPGTLSSVRDVVPVPVSTGISEYVPLYAQRPEAGK